MKKNKNNITFIKWLMDAGRYDVINPDEKKYTLEHWAAWKNGEDPKEFRKMCS